jgi:homoserine kinase
LSEIYLRAPATIANVGPGFDIFAVALDQPFDLFKISLRHKSRDISIKCFGGEADIPVCADKNTAGLAAKHLLAELKASVGVEIEIHKRMPFGAGLGSSAASAAACVFGLNRLLGANLDENRLIEAASFGEIASGGTAHADNVAGCLLGGFVLIRRFAPLETARISLPKIPIVIRVMRKTQTTTRGQIPPSFSLAEVKLQMSLCAEVARAVAAGDIKAFGQAINRDLISEPVRGLSVPGYNMLKYKILEAGALGCNVSGGGSSVFAVCPPGRSGKIASVMRSIPLPDGRPPEIIMAKTSNQGVSVIDGL